MSFNYQALTGLSEITTDELTISGTLTTDKLTFPTGAHQGWVLTSDDIGSASWQELVKTLLGDVTGPFQTNVVTKVGGSTAANIHQAELLANAATDLNTADALVKRKNGNFSAGTITANLVGNVSGSSASFTGSLLGDITGTQGATVVSNINGKAANQTVTLTDIQTLTNKTITGTFTGSLAGNASTVTTNANLTGDITSVGNATTASAAIAKLTTAQTLTNKTITGTTNNVDANTIRNGSTWAVPFSGAAPTTSNILTYNGTNAVWQAPAAVSGVSTATASAVAQRDSLAGCAFGIVTATKIIDPSSALLLYADATNKNTFLGLSANSVGAPSSTYNVGVGYQALSNITSVGTANTAVGSSTLSALTSGNANTAIGSSALSSMISGASNTAIGVNALQQSTGTSSYNTACGTNALVNITSGSNNTAIGFQAGPPPASSTVSNTTA
ncbi:MAG: hypothetical protein P4N59_16290, partial [Negativicutes bacterium]|nr:hypothetical protein [Negativicutes bacterium]